MTVGLARHRRVQFRYGTIRHLRRVADAGGIIVVGEVHGVKENAAVVRRLIELLGVRHLALEWPADDAATLDRWIHHPAADPPAPTEDGRVNWAYLDMLREVTTGGHVDGCVLIDAGMPSAVSPPEARDQAMASLLLSQRPPGPVLAVVGSTHARRVRGSFADTLMEAGEEVATVVLRYGGGAYYNFGVHAFPRHRAPMLRRHARPRECFVRIPLAHPTRVPEPTDGRDDGAEVRPPYVAR